MARFKTAALSLVTALGLFSASASAVNVGDKPVLDFTSYDGKKVNRQTLDGKIVVVDFWATWCGPCIQQVPHMLSLNEKYGPKGLAMIGISLDQSQAALKRGVQEHKLNWPHHFDGKGWGNKYAKEWGVQGIPKTFILSPDGEVLWAGHPARIDEPLEKAFKEHPPRLVDRKTLADATASLEAAEAALKSGDTRAALKAAAKFPAAAKSDAATAERAEKLQAELTSAADKMLADVDPLVEKGNFAEAVARLKELEAMSGLPAAQQARSKLADLMARPDVKAKFEQQEKARLAAERTKAAAGALAAAKSLRTAKKHEEAYARFKQVAKEYADTRSAAEASAAVAAYEKDPAFVRRVNEAAAGTKAKGVLALAQSYRASGRKDLARKKYESIISEFPGTSFAEIAEKEIKAMGN